MTILFNARYFSENSVHCMYDGASGGGMKQSYKQNKLKKKSRNKPKTPTKTITTL